MTKETRNNYKYIYNVNLANNLMRNGYVCKGTGINYKTGSFFWCFDYNEVQPYYDKINSMKFDNEGSK